MRVCLLALVAVELSASQLLGQPAWKFEPAFGIGGTATDWQGEYYTTGNALVYRLAATRQLGRTTTFVVAGSRIQGDGQTHIECTRTCGAAVHSTSVEASLRAKAPFSVDGWGLAAVAGAGWIRLSPSGKTNAAMPEGPAWSYGAEFVTSRVWRVQAGISAMNRRVISPSRSITKLGEGSLFLRWQ